MTYCAPKGIPLSTFLSWSDVDQDEALAWQAWESRRCQDCGTHREDWDPLVGGSRYAHHAEISTCQGCVERQRAEDSQEVKGGGRGIHVRLAPGAYGECVRCRPR